MPNGNSVENPGQRAGDTAGSVFQRNASAPSVDWSKGGSEHFDNFKQSLGDLAKDKSLEPIKDFHGLAKGYTEAQKMIGSSIRLPKKDGKPEERQKAIGDIMSKLRSEGILESPPESWEKYDVKFPEVFDGQKFQINQGLYDAFRKLAHKEGLSNNQAQKFFDWYLDFQASAKVQEDQNFDTMRTGLKKEWGGLFKRNVETAIRGVKHYLNEAGLDATDEEAEDLIRQSEPEIGYKLLKIFSVIGQPLYEDALIEGERLGVSNLEEVDKKIMTMMNDPKHPLNDISHSQHKAAVEEYSKLQQMKIQLTKK